MDRRKKRDLERVLRVHYAAQKAEAPEHVPSSLMEAMLAEDKRAIPASQLASGGIAAFVASQVAFIPAWVWVFQLTIVVLMAWLAAYWGDIVQTWTAVGILSAVSVLACVPTVRTNVSCGMVELEYSCRRNAVQVLAACLIVLGCSSSLCVGLMIASSSALTGTGPLSAALWSCPPYFCSCAGVLALARSSGDDPSFACLIWIACVCALSLILGADFPVIYGGVSLGFWAAASGLALAWLAGELGLLMKAAKAGLDFLRPQTARICE